MKKTSLQTALNIQLSKSCNNVLHGFYLRFINKPRMLNDILPLGDPKSSSGVRQNVVWSRSVIISCPSYKLGFLLWKIPLTYNYTQNYIVHRLRSQPSIPALVNWHLFSTCLSCAGNVTERAWSLMCPHEAHTQGASLLDEIDAQTQSQGTPSPPWPVKDQGGSLQFLGYRPSHTASSYTEVPGAER